jgi:hypothetical protein
MMTGNKNKNLNNVRGGVPRADPIPAKIKKLENKKEN